MNYYYYNNVACHDSLIMMSLCHYSLPIHVIFFIFVGFSPNELLGGWEHNKGFFNWTFVVLTLIFIYLHQFQPMDILCIHYIIVSWSWMMNLWTKLKMYKLQSFNCILIDLFSYHYVCMYVCMYAHCRHGSTHDTLKSQGENKRVEL